MPRLKEIRGDLDSYSISDNQAGIKTQSRTYSLVQRVEAVGQGIRRIRAVLEMGI
jgi:hypothetical protein